MKYLMIGFVSLTLSYHSVANEPDINAMEDVAKSKIKLFASQLKSTLQSGVKTGGLTGGIQICSESAIGIANAHSDDGWSVARTSLKVRNEQNLPDLWELAQLKAFQKQLAEGKSVHLMSASAVQKGANGSAVYRYIKPISTGALCLNCHGQNIKTDVAAKIKELYPNDKAVGFQLGDIRGAFTLQKKLD